MFPETNSIGRCEKHLFWKTLGKECSGIQLPISRTSFEDDRLVPQIFCHTNLKASCTNWMLNISLHVFSLCMGWNFRLFYWLKTSKSSTRFWCTWLKLSSHRTNKRSHTKGVVDDPKAARSILQRVWKKANHKTTEKDYAALTWPLGNNLLDNFHQGHRKHFREKHLVQHLI